MIARLRAWLRRTFGGWQLLYKGSLDGNLALWVACRARREGQEGEYVPLLISAGKAQADTRLCIERVCWEIEAGRAVPEQALMLYLELTARGCPLRLYSSGPVVVEVWTV